MFASIPRVWHVGTLERESRTARASLEAFMLSVSEHPDEWGSIARCGGTTWTLDRGDALWLDAHALDDDALRAIREWGIARGYAEARTIWRAWHYDDELDDWRYMSFLDEEKARYEVDGDDCPEGEVPSENGELVDTEDGVVLTDLGMSRLERWHDRTMGEDGLLILWAQDVLLPENPEMVGIWWYDDTHPEALSCPRGGLFPERMGDFEIRDEHGSLMTPVHRKDPCDLDPSL